MVTWLGVVLISNKSEKTAHPTKTLYSNKQSIITQNLIILKNFLNQQMY